MFYACNAQIFWSKILEILDADKTQEKAIYLYPGSKGIWERETLKCLFLRLIIWPTQRTSKS